MNQFTAESNGLKPAVVDNGDGTYSIAISDAAVSSRLIVGGVWNSTTAYAANTMVQDSAGASWYCPADVAAGGPAPAAPVWVPIGSDASGCELITNKSTDSTLGGATPSDTLYPSQKAVRSAIDAISTDSEAIAWIDISGGRAVGFRAGVLIYADSSDPSVDFAGVSVGACASGRACTYRQIGPIEDSSWSFTPGDSVFVGTLGILTHTRPISGYSQRIGYATSATSILLLVEPSIGLV
jgi:hypothetical protein